MRLRDVMQQLYRTYQRIDIDLPADCPQVAWEFREHYLPETSSDYLIILEFDVPRILEAIALHGLGMYCQDLAETTNAKLKDFYLRFTNRGASTTGDYQLSALLQTMEHVILYTHSHIVAHGTTRLISCPNAALFESLIDDAAQWADKGRQGRCRKTGGGICYSPSPACMCCSPSNLVFVRIFESLNDSRSKILLRSNIRIFVRRYFSNLSRCAQELLEAHPTFAPASRSSPGTPCQSSTQLAQHPALQRAADLEPSPSTSRRLDDPLDFGSQYSEEYDPD